MVVGLQRRGRNDGGDDGQSSTLDGQPVLPAGRYRVERQHDRTHARERYRLPEHRGVVDKERPRCRGTESRDVQRE